MSILALPDWVYDTSKLTGDQLQANTFLKDYYGQMANSYLPSLDEFAKTNAGQMVSYDPNRFMSIEDFGLGVARGDLRNQNLINDSHNISLDGFGEDYSGGYYYLDDQGRYQLAIDPSKIQGKELFTLGNVEPSWENDFQGGDTYTSAGNFHRETPQEAVARLLAQGGDYATGGNRGNTRRDFMGQTTFDDLIIDNSDKWGRDVINNPELAKYFNDPNWVARDENGNITQIRSELYPLLMREALGEEFRDMNRGGTKQAGGFGDLVKMAVLGVATGGLGLGGAQALGMGTAAAGSTMAATAAGMGVGGLATAGAIAGGLSAGLTEQDILKGILTGGVLGGVGGIARNYAPGISNATGLNTVFGDKVANKIVAGGIKGVASGALKGDAASGFVGGVVNPMIGYGINEGLGLIGDGASYVGDALFGSDDAPLTDQQVAESFGNPDFYANTLPIGTGEQTGYTSLGQGDTNMDDWLSAFGNDSDLLNLAINSSDSSDWMDYLINNNLSWPGVDTSNLMPLDPIDWANVDLSTLDWLDPNSTSLDTMLQLAILPESDASGGLSKFLSDNWKVLAAGGVSIADLIGKYKQQQFANDTSRLTTEQNQQVIDNNKLERERRFGLDDRKFGQDVIDSDRKYGLDTDINNYNQLGFDRNFFNTSTGLASDETTSARDNALIRQYLEMTQPYNRMRESAVLKDMGIDTSGFDSMNKNQAPMLQGYLSTLNGYEDSFNNYASDILGRRDDANSYSSPFSSYLGRA